MPGNGAKQGDVIAQVFENECFNMAYESIDIDIDCKLSYKNYSASSGLMITASIGVLNQAVEAPSQNGFDTNTTKIFAAVTDKN